MFLIGWLLKLPGIVKGIGSFLARTWKIWAVVIVIGFVWFAGRWYKERGWLEREVGTLQALRDDAAERERVLRAEHDERLVRDRLVREQLGRDLTALRQRESVLRDELEFAELELVKPLNPVTVPGELTCENTVIANPFGADFIRLFNEYGRLGAVRADPETGTD